MDFSVIGFGALNYDYLYKVRRIARGGEHIPIESVTEAPGGSGANTISALSRLRVKTGFIGIIGDDKEGKEIIKDFKNYKVNCSGIKRLKNKKTGTIIGFVDEKGERTLYPYPSANNSLLKKDIRLSYVKKTKFLHLTSFVSDEQFETQEWLVGKLNKKVKVSFSPGDLYVKRGLHKLSFILKRSEVAFFNSEEIEILTGLDNYMKSAKFLVDDIGVKIVVVTLGKKGAYIKTKDESIFERGFKTKKIVDTTGAGDAFSGGFIYGLLNDMPLSECGVIGNFLAGRCIQEIGARKGLPTKKEVKEFLYLHK